MYANAYLLADNRLTINRIYCSLRKENLNRSVKSTMGVQDVFRRQNQLISRNYLNQNNSSFNRPALSLDYLPWGFVINLVIKKLKTIKNQKKKQKQKGCS